MPTQKVHGADYVVADVCATCNGGPLSELDTYFCALYDDYLHELHDFGSELTVTFNYRLLLRALLKISYNAARSGASNVVPFLPLRQFILGGAEPPDMAAVFLELVAPSTFPDEVNTSIPRKVFPNTYRAAITRFTRSGGDRLLSRLVAVNSFYFHLHLPLRGMRPQEFEYIVDDFSRTVEGVVRLSDGTDSVVLRTSPQDGVKSMLPNLMRHRDQYEQYFARKRGK